MHGFGHRRHVRPPTPSVGLQRRPAFGALVPCTQLLSIASAWMSQRPLKPTCPKQSSRVSPSQTKHTSESFSASNLSSSANERPPARPFPKTLGASRSLAHLHLDGGPVANCVDSTSAAPVGAVSPQSPCATTPVHATVDGPADPSPAPVPSPPRSIFHTAATCSGEDTKQLFSRLRLVRLRPSHATQEKPAVPYGPGAPARRGSRSPGTRPHARPAPVSRP